ncbi:hypothetical protein L1987_13582 [Smallanthus sonchifolius]|uniref:Uncharacterized protein n=1 Tax=Smallanthus sonchifolius TaxID=185202 RepID=A0ACB9JHC5_9ASTR|nr:hypothetical protein L1987_13582 [Smallanthus sonchifolius]
MKVGQDGLEFTSDFLKTVETPEQDVELTQTDEAENPKSPDPIHVPDYDPSTDELYKDTSMTKAQCLDMIKTWWKEKPTTPPVPVLKAKYSKVHSRQPFYHFPAITHFVSINENLIPPEEAINRSKNGGPDPKPQPPPTTTEAPFTRPPASPRRIPPKSSTRSRKRSHENQRCSFCKQAQAPTAEILAYDYVDIAFSPLGDYWRQMRKICMLELLSVRKVESFESIPGTDTSPVTIEWTMYEFMKNPKIMNKVQAELRHVLKGKKKIYKSDMKELTYLKLVIKETLRLHAPLPLLLPRECQKNSEIGGYDIPANTKVIINYWKIGLDPKY